MATILVTDDDPTLVEVLEFLLGRAGHDVISSYDGITALRNIELCHPDVAILDVNLPVWNGFEMLERIRQLSTMPVIFLSARASEDDGVQALRMGADDSL